MTISKDQVRTLVTRQIRVDHPEYTEAQLKRAIDETIYLIDQVQEVK